MADKKTIIKNIPIGKAKAISMDELERKIGNIKTGTNNDTTRSEIRKIISDCDAPIGSCRNGVYIPANKDELQEIIDNNKRIADRYNQKALNIKKAYDKWRDEK